jgi:hypothetical protein
MIHEVHRTGVTGETGIYYMRDQQRSFPALIYLDFSSLRSETLSETLDWTRSANEKVRFHPQAANADLTSSSRNKITYSVNNLLNKLIIFYSYIKVRY